MSKYHLDVEVIVTKRIHLSNDADIDSIEELISDNEYDIPEELGFIECEYLSDTEMLHEYNDALAGTKQPMMMDLYEEGKIIYQNSIL